jgi:hypothetical protein
VGCCVRSQAIVEQQEHPQRLNGGVQSDKDYSLDYEKWLSRRVKDAEATGVLAAQQEELKE